MATTTSEENTKASGHKPGCIAEHQEWSGTPRDDDSGWDCDHCGAFIPVEPEPAGFSHDGVWFELPR